MGFHIDRFGGPAENPCAANASGLSMGILLTSMRPSGTRGRGTARVEVKDLLDVEGKRREHVQMDLVDGIKANDMLP